jgi:hypothetical protein
MPRIMYDSTDPNAIPTNAEMVAGYIDGTSFKWPESAWARFPKARKVRIARRVTTNDGHVLDVESGIPTVWPPTQAIVQWVQMRRRSGVDPTIYCNQLNDWPLIRSLFINAQVPEPYWWVARYNGSQTIPTGAVAKQYANSTMSGGHYDLSSVVDYWPGVDPERRIEGISVANNSNIVLMRGDQSFATYAVKLDPELKTAEGEPTAALRCYVPGPIGPALIAAFGPVIVVAQEGFDSIAKVAGSA